MKAKIGFVIFVLLLVVGLVGCDVLLGADDDEGSSGGDTTPTVYQVTYDANGGDAGAVPESQTKIEGVDLTLASNSGSLARAGYSFAGWNTAADGSGTDYAEGATYSADADVTLYAKWTAEIGDTGPAGGIVFYDKGSYSDGWRYLEAWTADETGGYQWKTSNTSTTGTSTAVGSGYANTYTAMAGSEHPAAEVVRNATHGGRNDWFLPSKDELNQMYLQRGNIGGFVADYYWSSSEYSANGAWIQYLINGDQLDPNKNNDYRVRAVRAF